MTMRIVGNKTLIGIDESGRGPIAGPVAVGVFVVFNEKWMVKFRGVKESKQLSRKSREVWYEKILKFRQENVCDFAVNMMPAEHIDKYGISKCVQRGIDRGLRQLAKRDSITAESRILLDGLLRAPENYKYQKTIIGGDRKEKVIALASICAKVARDRFMLKMNDRFPQYGFDKHKGYGTKVHYAAIAIHGPSKLHRLTFL
ncbi:MAG: ribonuclease HII [Patescibacteria group bacterium]|nr:ribonuclease HII [Patescibacteria group bacterium]